MLELLDSIPVTFGPHAADWLLVSFTAAATLASAALGWLAYRNGRTATRIASEAAARDRRLGRDSAALAMFHAIAAGEELASSAADATEDAQRQLSREFHAKQTEALALLDLHAGTEDPEVREWFVGVMRPFARGYLSQSDQSIALQSVNQVRDDVRSWHQFKYSGAQLSGESAM